MLEPPIQSGHERQFVDATASGYQPFGGCASGPDHRAMGMQQHSGGRQRDRCFPAGAVTMCRRSVFPGPQVAKKL